MPRHSSSSGIGKYFVETIRYKRHSAKYIVRSINTASSRRRENRASKFVGGGMRLIRGSIGLRTYSCPNQPYTISAQTETFNFPPLSPKTCPSLTTCAPRVKCRGRRSGWWDQVYGRQIREQAGQWKSCDRLDGPAKDLATESDDEGEKARWLIG